LFLLFSLYLSCGTADTPQRMNKYAGIIATASGNVNDFSNLKCKFSTSICNEKI